MAAFNHLLCAAALILPCLATGFEQQPFQYHDDHGSSLIHDILVRNEIIGDVLDDFDPTMSLSISYPDSHETVLLGNDIPVSSVSDPPIFEFHPFVGPHNVPPSHQYAQRTSKTTNRRHRSSPLSPSTSSQSETEPEDLVYTAVLTDPDAKSRSNPIWSEMAHWIVTNLTLVPTSSSSLSSSSSLISLSPSTLLPYLTPSPPPKTGSHRYVFVLLSGSPEATAKLVPPKKSKEGRQHWGYDEERTGVKKWAEDNGGLEVVGVNFFFARNEKQ